MKMGIARYEKIRQDPCLFLVRPGHEIGEIEDVCGDRGACRRPQGDNLAALAAGDPAT